MKSKMLLIALAALVLLGTAPSVFAQSGDGDDGVPDSLIWIASRPEVGANDSTFMMELYYWGDLDSLTGIAVGWKWDNPNLHLDTAYVSAEAASVFGLLKQTAFGGDLQRTNDSQLVVCVLARSSGWGLILDGNRHLLATYEFSLSSWSGSDQVVFDTVLTEDPMGVAGVTQVCNDPLGGEWIPVMPNPFIIQDPSDLGDLFDPTVPSSFELAQNYPNPFNPTTTIQFGLPTKSKVELSVFNLLGQKVRTLRNEEMDAGTYSIEWNGTNDGGAKVASGVYFYKLETSDFVDTKKMMLVK